MRPIAPTNPGESQPRLLQERPEGARTCVLSHFPFTLGRSGENDLCITEGDISRRHAMIESMPDGLYLRDLGSRHGTLHNGAPVTVGRLTSGDRISLGRGGASLVYLDELAPSRLALDGLDQSPEGAGTRPTGTIAAPYTSARALLARVSSEADGSDLEKLSLFLEAAQRFSGTELLDDVLSTMTEYALRLTAAERGFVFLGESATTLRLRTGRANDGAALDDDAKISRSILRDAARSGQDYILGDATDDGAAVGRDSIVIHALRSVIAIPLRSRGTRALLGVLYLDSRLQSCNLSAVSRDILRAIAMEAATLVENARMLEAEQAAALLRKEMEIAASIQQRIIISDLPPVPGFAIQARTLPCSQVGGDFYDVIATPEGFVVIIADVSGKGVSAALLASVAQGMMYAQITSGRSLVDSFQVLNTFLCARVSGAKYLTMLALHCRMDGSITLVNGGHVPPVLVTPDGSVRALEDGDMPVGILPGATFHSIALEIDAGSRIVLLSDGVSESEDQQGEQFTLEHFQQHLMAADPIAALFSAVDEFSRGIPQADDRTVLTIDRLAERSRPAPLG